MKRRYQSHLHSNLVIFESERPESLKMQLKKFTFQSGDIRITMFEKGNIPENSIYIPIW